MRSLAVASDLRTSGVFRRARCWLDEPSPLFELLVALDAREGSDAVIAHASRVASILDPCDADLSTLRVADVTPGGSLSLSRAPDRGRQGPIRRIPR